MIGDDVGFRRRYPWWPLRIVQHAWNRLECHVRGHFYRPSYYQLGNKVQYTCSCCGEKTKWMDREEHGWFNLIQCPTWGDRGSDSQGYLFIGPQENRRRPWRPRRGRKRYKK